MEEIVSIQSPPTLFKTYYSLAIRIWHWVTFITISASIIMVLLASTVFTTKSNINMVQEQIQRKGAVVSPEQARAVAHEFSDKLWNLHKYIGFGLCFLFLARVVIEVSSSKEQRLLNKIHKASTLKITSAAQQYDQNHYILVKRVYVAFYGLLFIMALSGLGLAFEDVPLLRSIHKTLTAIHSFVQYPIYFYIFIHLAGVIKADVTDNRGIVSAMINGGDNAL